MSDSVVAAVSGGVGGIIAMTLTYPLGFLSTRAAVESKASKASTIEAIRKVLKQEGFLGLYAGLSTSLVGIAATNTVFYLFFEESKTLLSDLKSRSAKAPSPPGTIETLLASTLAGAVTTITTNPIWLIQTYQATRTTSISAETKVEEESEKKSGDVEQGLVGEGGKEGDLKREEKKREKERERVGAIRAAKELIKKDGIGALWKGLGPSLILVVNPIIQYTAYERLSTLLSNYRQRKGKARRISDVDVFLLGALAKLVATVSTYPILVVKSRLHAATHAYKSSLKGILTILQEEGIGGLYRGMTAKLLQSVLTAAFLFMTQRRIFELLKQVITLRRALTTNV